MTWKLQFLRKHCFHQFTCLAQNLTILHTSDESLSCRDCNFFLFHFHCKHPSGDTLNEWHSTIFGEVESSWRWTLLHDVLRRRFLEIYNFRNWSATHGCVYENIELHRRSAEQKSDYWMIVQNKFLASFYLQIACFIALARQGIACVGVDCSCTHTALIFITQTYVQWWSWKMCNKRPHKTVWAAWSAVRWETSLYSDSSKQFNTFSDYPVIVLRILILHFVCGLDLELSLCFPSRFVLFVCCNITPPGHDGDWIENWVFSFRISRNIQSKKCANNGWLKVKVKR